MAFFCSIKTGIIRVIKILGIAPYTFLPPQMGGQKYIDIFYRYLGAEVATTVASTAANDGAYAANFTLVKVFDNSKSRYGNPAYFFTLKNLIKKEGITHLIIEHPYMGWMAVALQRATGVKLIVHSHNIESERFKSLGKPWWKPLWQYERWVHRQANFSFFITPQDQQYAIEKYGLSAEKCDTAFYGIEQSKAPSNEEKAVAKKTVCNALQLSPATRLLFFNGNFLYAPNKDALLVLLEKIVPALQNDGFDFTLIVCGKGAGSVANMDLPASVRILDFVPNIDIYNLAADVFLNPVMEGGGVKTKLVEALAANTAVVSTYAGATGIQPGWCGGKLTLVPDGDWVAFSEAIQLVNSNDAAVSEEFFKHFYMGNIAKKVVRILQSPAL